MGNKLWVHYKVNYQKAIEYCNRPRLMKFSIFSISSQLSCWETIIFTTPQQQHFRSVTLVVRLRFVLNKHFVSVCFACVFRTHKKPSQLFLYVTTINLNFIWSCMDNTVRAIKWIIQDKLLQCLYYFVLIPHEPVHQRMWCSLLKFSLWHVLIHLSLFLPI